MAGVLVLAAVGLVEQLVSRWGGLGSFPPAAETAAVPSPSFPLLLIDNLLSWAIWPLLYVGYQYLALRAAQGEEATLGDMLAPVRHPLSVLGAYWLTALITAVGLLLLVIPGIVWSLKFMFAALVAVDKGRTAFDALGESGELTRGHKWPLLGLGAVFVLFFGSLAAVGYFALIENWIHWGLWLFLSLGAQLLFMPWLTAAFAAAYRDLEAARGPVDPEVGT